MPQTAKDQILETVIDKLIELNSKTDRMQSELGEVKDQTTKLVTLLLGDDDPSTGLIIRMDRLERDKEKSSWFVRSVGAAAITAIVVALLTWFTHGRVTGTVEPTEVNHTQHGK